MARNILCNCCGKKLDSLDACGAVSISRILGYGSKYDGAYVEIDICPSCFDRFMDSMAIPPVLSD